MSNPDTYVRNAFKFNVCFVLKPNANTTCYEKVLKKLVQYLTVLEVCTTFIFSLAILYAATYHTHLYVT